MSESLRLSVSSEEDARSDGGRGGDMAADEPDAKVRCSCRTPGAALGERTGLMQPLHRSSLP
jgi:hypothetical protein